MNKPILLRLLKSAPILFLVILVSCSEGPVIQSTESKVTLRNDWVGLEFDLILGTYNIWDLRKNTLTISDAMLKMNDWTSVDEGCQFSWKEHKVKDGFGNGVSLDLTIETPNMPIRLFSFALYEDYGFFNVGWGLKNTTESSIQIKEVYVLSEGLVYEGTNVSDDFAMVDGFSGGEPLEYGRRMYSPLTRSNALKSRNNILLTFTEEATRHTMLLGGLTYDDFEKFATIQQARKVELNKGKDGKSSLLCYLNLPDDRSDEAKGGETLTLIKGEKKRIWQYVEFRCEETATSVMEPGNIVIEAENINVDKSYYLGFSWWRNLWHGNRPDLWQSVYFEYNDDGRLMRLPILEDHLMPRFDGRSKDDVEQLEVPVPVEVVKSGQFRIVVEKPKGSTHEISDENVYLSEVWLRDRSFEPLLPPVPTPLNACERARREFTAQLFAMDPVGKRIDPGVSYLSGDRFYIDVNTVDPYTALEQYGLSVSEAQNIDLSMYDFPSVCLWYAEHEGYGGGNAENTTLGAVNEMKIIKDKGFLNYSRVAVRLVPDSYLPDNQQGWWDDEHWQMEETDRNASQNGRYVEPYETSEKWGKAVTDLGGIPLTYFQAGFRSEDYAKAKPEHMLFNKTYAWRGAPQDTLSDLFTTWNASWSRNRIVWGYDYSDSDFLKHLKEVYENLATGGIKGLMFDYPGYAWSYGGGMEDKYSTTTAAYRNIFRMPYEGLGPGSYVHERNMERGTDISIGYVASMRTENDTDMMDETTVTRCGLRWYKNRVLYNQDTDSKNIARLQDNRDHVRALVTMAYVVTGRLLLANSFSQFTDETYWDITRTFPYHTENKSARPVDAFVSDFPAVYDFEVNQAWHQVTFYNPDVEKSKTVGINLAGEPVDGALNLNPDKTYLVYDFWNDRFVGDFAGSERLAQNLRPGEARMMSVRENLNRPQVISTNRHIMQGYLDMEGVEWNGKKKVLSGTSKVVGGDQYVIIVAANGFNPEDVKCDDVNAQITFNQSENGLIKIIIESGNNQSIKWRLKCTSINN